MVIKTKWYWHKDGKLDQWNKTKNPEIKPCVYVQLISTWSSGVFSGKEIVFSTNCAMTIWYHIKIKKWDASLTWYTIINSKLMKAQMRNQKTSKPLEMLLTKYTTGKKLISSVYK